MRHEAVLGASGYDMATILAVDDEPHLLTIYEYLLGHYGFDVVTATSCAEALRKLHEANPAVLIVDLRLPDGDGLEIIRQARRRPSPIPSILVTACDLETIGDAAAAAGADRCFTKPFNTAALVAAVRELVVCGASPMSDVPAIASSRCA